MTLYSNEGFLSALLKGVAYGHRSVLFGLLKFLHFYLLFINFLRRLL